MSSFKIILAYFLINCIFLANCDLNKDRTFLSIDNSIPCVRRFNSTHQIGCGKLDKSKYDGIVYAVRDLKEFKRLDRINNLGSKQLILITIPETFSMSVDYYLKNKDTKENKINGIVLLASPSYTKNFILNRAGNYSDDAASPNYFFSLYSNNKQYAKYDWNPSGFSYMFQNFEIPFYVITNETEARLPLDNCYDKFNAEIFERADNKSLQIRYTDLLCGMQLGL